MPRERERERNCYLPTCSVSPRKMAPIKAAMAIPRGLNIATNTGPFFCMHHVSTENVTTLPKTACAIRNECRRLELLENKDKLADKMNCMLGAY
jgi:hypothetical protein